MATMSEINQNIPTIERATTRRSLEHSSIFADKVPLPQSDREALAECVEVLERIMQDYLLCGAGAQRMRPDGKIERPLYGCAVRAINHAKERLKKA